MKHKQLSDSLSLSWGWEITVLANPDHLSCCTLQTWNGDLQSHTTLNHYLLHYSCETRPTNTLKIHGFSSNRTQPSATIFSVDYTFVTLTWVCQMSDHFDFVSAIRWFLCLAIPDAPDYKWIQINSIFYFKFSGCVIVECNCNTQIWTKRLGCPLHCLIYKLPPSPNCYHLTVHIVFR